MGKKTHHYYEVLNESATEARREIEAEAVNVTAMMTWLKENMPEAGDNAGVVIDHHGLHQVECHVTCALPGLKKLRGGRRSCYAPKVSTREGLELKKIWATFRKMDHHAFAQRFGKYDRHVSLSGFTMVVRETLFLASEDRVFLAAPRKMKAHPDLRPCSSKEFKDFSTAAKVNFTTCPN
jgi:hypothetical protein